MNQLKYVLGINVPRRVPSSAAIVNRCSNGNEICRRRPMKPRPLKSDRSLSQKSRKNYDFRDLRCSTQKEGALHSQQRSKLKSSAVSSKRLPLDRSASIDSDYKHSRRYSTNQIAKPRSGKRRIGQNVEKIAERAWNSKEFTTSGMNMAAILCEKEPRSYAQMIANYSAGLQIKSPSGIFGDCLNARIGGDVRRSPFTTSSTISPKRKNVDGTMKGAFIRTSSPNRFNQGVKFSSESSTARYARDGNQHFIGTIGEDQKVQTSLNDPEKTSSSYATMITKYSRGIDFGGNLYGWNNNIAPKRHVSTNKIESSSMMFLDVNSFDDKTSRIRPNDEGTVIPINASNKGQDGHGSGVKKEDTWLTKVEGVIKDLKQVTAQKDVADGKSAEKMNDKWILRSVNQRAHWLDRVVEAHKRKIGDKGSTSGNTANVMKKSASDNDKNKSLPEALKSSHSQPPKSDERTLNSPMSQYISRGPVNTTSSTKKDSSQTPAGLGINPLSEQQIELRMTPSQNESVVYINVDDQTSKTADRANNEPKGVSVTICSNQNTSTKSNTSNLNVSAAAPQLSNNATRQTVHSDFGSMHISISEKTIPVKQIEFSINGKPVSELKSIVARAEHLDVFSSMDKVQIKIPFSKDSAKLTNEQGKNLVKSVSSTGPVLNLQIAAKFNEPRLGQTTDTSFKSEPKGAPKPNHYESPKSQYIFSPESVNNRDSKLTNENTMNNTDTITAIDTKQPQNKTDIKNTDFHVGTKSHAHNPGEDKMKISDVLENKGPSVRGNEAAPRENSGISAHTKGPPGKSPLTISDPDANNSTDERVPSNIIPWWSSEDAFNKIRKKENTPTPIAPPLDTNEKKTAAANETQGSMDVTWTQEKTKNPKVSEHQQSNAAAAPNITTPIKDSAAKKLPLDEINKTSEVSKPPVLKISSARNPQKSESMGPDTSKARITESLTKWDGTVDIARLMRKKMKYRFKDDTSPRSKSAIVKTAATVDVKTADLETIPVSLRPGPIKYEVRGHGNDMSDINDKNKKPKLIEKTSSSTEVAVKERQKIDNEKAQKAEGNLKTGEKTEKETKVNLENLIKQIKRTENIANSPKTPRNASNTARLERDFTKKGEEDIITRSRAVKSASAADKRMKDILDSMKPIEKRKDGTLIDYGVTVSSRKKPDRRDSKMSKISNKSPVNVEVKEVISETTKTSPNTPNQAKSVKVEKAPAIKKPPETKNMAGNTEANKSVRDPIKVKTENQVMKNSLEKEHKRTQESRVFPANVGKNKERGSGVKNKQDKNDTGITDFAKLNQPLNVSNSTSTGKAPFEGTLNNHAPVRSMETPDTKSSKFLTSVSREKLATVSFKGTVAPSSVQPREKQIESKKAGRPATVPSTNDSSRTAQTSKKIFHKSEDAPLEGTIFHRSFYSVDNKVSNDVPPLADTIVPSPAKGLNVKLASGDDTRLTRHQDRRTTNTFAKHFEDTGIAPLEGTIKYQTSKTRETIVNMPPRTKPESKPRKAASSVVKKRRALSKASVARMFPKKDRGGSESNGASNVPTGPAGIKPNTGSLMNSRAASGDSILLPKGCSMPKQGLHGKVDKRDDSIPRSSLRNVPSKTNGIQGSQSMGQLYCTPKSIGSLFFVNGERPEKGILYSAWLQRFKNDVDDDKIS